MTATFRVRLGVCLMLLACFTAYWNKVWSDARVMAVINADSYLAACAFSEDELTPTFLAIKENGESSSPRAIERLRPFLTGKTRSGCRHDYEILRYLMTLNNPGVVAELRSLVQGGKATIITRWYLARLETKGMPPRSRVNAMCGAVGLTVGDCAKVRPTMQNLRARWRGSFHLTPGRFADFMLSDMGKLIGEMAREGQDVSGLADELGLIYRDSRSIRRWGDM